jgi:hypothetical protein
MNKINVLFCCILILLAGSYTSAQEGHTTSYEIKSRKLVTTKTSHKIKETGQFDPTTNDEASYYAPIRYVIVYNEILTKINERRIEILIDEKSYTEEILATIFQHIAKKFPNPIQLEITAHTNLATIETPEERQMMRDGEGSRFKNVRSRYKTSTFGRNEAGRESIFHQISINPENYEVIVLEEGKSPNL